MCTSVLICVGNMPRTGIAQSYGHCIFKLLRKCQVVFQDSSTILLSHQQWVFWCFHTLLKLVNFLILSMLVGMKWLCSAFFLWLMILSIFSCAYWPFVYLLIPDSSVKSFTHYLFRLFVFSLLNHRSALHIQDTSSLLDIRLTATFSNYVGCLTFVMVFCEAWKLYILIKLTFVVHGFGVLRNYCLT